MNPPPLVLTRDADDNPIGPLIKSQPWDGEMMTSNRNYAMVITAVLSLGAGAAYACNVPVFRFALERWRADPYRVTLFHRGALTNEQRSVLQELEAQQEKGAVNYVVRVVDVEQQLDGRQQELLASHVGAELPRLVVQYPEHLRIDGPVWTGELTREATAVLSNSPVRKELIQRLADGQTAVWLLLDSGVPAKDQAAAARMEEELKKLERQLTLPVLTDAPADNLLTERPLKVAFSLLRVPRKDPREQVLVDMLQHSEPDLMEREDPLAFPVFGRGRALLPLVGAGITPENIHDSAAFLVGACSCEIKELNPGFDLLLAASWEEMLFPAGVPPTLLAAGDAAPPGDPVLVPIPGGSHADEKTVTSHAAPAPDQSHAKAKDAPPVDGLTVKQVLLTLLGMILLTMLVVAVVL